MDAPVKALNTEKAKALQAALAQIDSSLVRAGRVIEAVRTEQALGWRD